MSLPRIALLTTGGTIAGASTPTSASDEYTAGTLTGETLLDAVPGILEQAQIHVEPCLALDSKNMTPDHWAHIAHAARALLERPDIDGVVITHGTDTLEETALYLELVLPAAKPIVLTGAMRPADAISADGPANLLDAVRLAIAPSAHGHGVLVVFHEHILPARGLRKSHALQLDAFSATDGPVGTTRPAIRFFQPPAPRAAVLPWPDGPLPHVDILPVSVGTSPQWLELATRAGARGLVLSLPGNGNVPDAWYEPIRQLGREGLPIIRASRCHAGFIDARGLDVDLGTHPAGRLSPTQARVALMLALAGGDVQDFRRVALNAQNDGVQTS